MVKHKYLNHKGHNGMHKGTQRIINIASALNKRIFIMQFLLIAHDGADPGAIERRMNARPGHLEKVSLLKKAGGFLFGGAILDEDGLMKGSMIVYEFPDREALDNYLKQEPYITQNVWQEIEIRPFRLANIE